MAEDATKKEDIPSNLMDAEAQEHLKEMERKAQRISKVTLEIEQILLRDNMTWGEWGEIVELFSARIGYHVSKLPIKLPK